MKTFRLNKAIDVLNHGGFVKEPRHYFDQWTNLYDEFGDCIGVVTYDCYFAICEKLGYAQHGGKLMSGKYEEYCPSNCQEINYAWHYYTINGDLSLCKRMEQKR